MNSRLNQLDSLRGIAALTVITSHMLITFPNFARVTYGQDAYRWENLFKYSPLHLFWSGHEAVILFFVLSGFVLALPFYREKPFSYPSYLIKRVCRIYLPYLCVVLFAFLIKLWFYSGQISYLSDWFNDIGRHEITWRNVLGHLTLIGSFQNHYYNPVLWSLVHEMRISLIFPFVVMLIKRIHWGWSLSAGLLIYYLGYKLHTHSVDNDYFATFQYLLMFIIGAILAKHHHQIGRWLQRLHVGFQCLLLLGAITLYVSKWLFFQWQWAKDSLYNDFLIAIGGSLFLLFAIYCRPISRFLLKRPMQVLGHISYSLYLLHVLVFVSLIHLLTPYMPLWIILTMSPIAIFSISYLFHRYVELPTIRLGRTFSNRQGSPLLSPVWHTRRWVYQKWYQQNLY